MAPVAAAPVASGWRVLDLCASPGGKTGQLAAAVGDRGLVISNELNPTRARTLGGNAERLGLRQTVAGLASSDSEKYRQYKEILEELTHEYCE